MDGFVSLGIVKEIEETVHRAEEEKKIGLLRGERFYRIGHVCDVAMIGQIAAP